MSISLEQQCAVALLDSLRDVPWRIQHGNPERFVELDFEERLRHALSYAHGKTISLRVTAALDADTTPVTLASGETMSIESAETALFHKESNRTFPSLRKSLGAALSTFDSHQSVPFSAALSFAAATELQTLGELPPVDDVDDARQREIERESQSRDERQRRDASDVARSDSARSDSARSDSARSDSARSDSACSDVDKHGAPPEVDTPISLAESTLLKFVDDTADAFEGARSALSTSGRLPLDNLDAIMRGMDLPFEDGSFSSGRLLHTNSALKAVAAPFMVRDVVRVRSPRAFSGHVVTAVPGAVRMLFAPTLRAKRYLDSLVGGGAALGASLFTPSKIADPQARLFGATCAMGVMSPVGMRAIFDDSSQVAVRNARVLRATALMWARACATASLAFLRCGESFHDDIDAAVRDEEDDALTEIWADRDRALTEEVREALAGLFGGDVGLGFASALIAPPLPGALSLGGRLMRSGSAALAWSAAATLAKALRDRYDEAFALVPAPYERVADARSPLIDGALDIGDLFDVDSRSQSQGGALDFSEWVLELL